MKSRLLGALCVGIISLGLTATAGAALVNRGGGLIYDTDLDVTWLQDANYADTSGAVTSGVNGKMTWSEAIQWASTLTYYDSVRDETWTDWRLPEVPPGSTLDFSYDGSTTYGWNNTSVEMSHIYYAELGNLGRYDTSGVLLDPHGLTNNGPFINIQSQSLDPERADGDAYWYGSEFTPFDRGWYFRFDIGFQDATTKTNELFAWAVRNGDVGAVPVPATAWLFSSGLLSLIGIAKKRKRFS